MTIDGLRFSILASLAVGPQHGYGILRDIEETSDGPPPPVGSLYRVLDRLDADGLVVDAGSEIVEGRHRRYYQLTATGAAALEAAADSRARSARVARQRLRRLPTGAPSREVTA